jgi:hypothetical protein
MATASVLDWTVDDVAIWLRENGHEQYISLLCENHHIDGKALLLMTETDIRTDPLNIKVDLNDFLCYVFTLPRFYSYRVIQFVKNHVHK